MTNSTSHNEQPNRNSHASNFSDRRSARRYSTRRRQAMVLNLVLIGVVGLVIVGGLLWYFMGSAGQSSLDQPLTETVVRGVFVKEVLGQGEIQSSENVEIRCKVKSRYGSKGATVKEVIEEGKPVKGGDWLVTLRSDEIEASFEDQTIAVTNARDSLTAAQNNYDAAVIAKKEYLQGKYKEEREALLNTISEAEVLVEQAKEFYESSRKLQAKGFITGVQLRSDEARLDQAERQLRSANNSLTVLESLTKEKFEKTFESDINIAESKRKAAEKNLLIEEKQLAEIKEQLAACEIFVPEGKSGQVVYANIFSRRGNSEFVLEEGASVREGQVLIRLPNPDKMQVRATVNESRVNSLESGMAVTISVDALNGAQLKGTVTKVNQYAEPEGWGSGGVRKFAVYIDIVNPIEAIRSGMNAACTIETARLENQLMIPIQSVYVYRGKSFCLVKKGENEWETREITFKDNNDSKILIAKGLEEGEIIASNPAGYPELLELPDLPEIDPDEEKGKGRGKKGASKKRDKGKRPDKKGSKKTQGDNKKASKINPLREKSEQKSPKSKTDSRLTKEESSSSAGPSTPSTGAE